MATVVSRSHEWRDSQSIDRFWNNSRFFQDGNTSLGAACAMTDVEAARAEMASMLVAALEAAERTRDLSVAVDLTSSELALETHAKLQFDFPLVTPEALDCLAREMEGEIVQLADASDEQSGTKKQQSPVVYPITNALVTAVVEGASRTSHDTSVPATFETTETRLAFQNLLATLSVRAPYRLRNVGDDELLDHYLSQYHVDVVYVGQDDDARDEGEVSTLDDPPDCLPVHSQIAEIENSGSDSDSDLEPLESDPSKPFPLGVDNELMNQSNEDTEPLTTRVDRKLHDLLAKARVAFLDASADDGQNSTTADDERNSTSTSQTRTSAWQTKGVTSCCVGLVEALCLVDADSRPARRDLLHHPLRLLREYWNTKGVGDDIESDALRKCLKALNFGEESNQNREENINIALCLETVGSLCVRFVFSADSSVYFVSSKQEETSARALWKSVAQYVGAIANALDATIGSLQKTKNKTISEDYKTAIGACSVSLAFYAARAPGNAAVGDVLLKSGAVRAAVGVFCMEGELVSEDRVNSQDNQNDSEKNSFGSSSDPSAEATRRLLLVGSAASAEVAAFVSAVPGVIQLIESHSSFHGNERNAAHGALWELVFASAGGSTNDTQIADTKCAERFTLVISESSASAVDALGLLRLVQLASRARVHTAPAVFLADTNGALRKALRSAATAHASAVAAAAATRAEIAAAGVESKAKRKPSGSDDESDGDGEMVPPAHHNTPAYSDIASEFEKKAHASSASLRLIKEIVDGFSGGARGKSD